MFSRISEISNAVEKVKKEIAKKNKNDSNCITMFAYEILKKYFCKYVPPKIIFKFMILFELLIYIKLSIEETIPFLSFQKIIALGRLQ